MIPRVAIGIQLPLLVNLTLVKPMDFRILVVPFTITKRLNLHSVLTAMQIIHAKTSVQPSSVVLIVTQNLLGISPIEMIHAHLVFINLKLILRFQLTMKQRMTLQTMKLVESWFMSY